MTKDLNNKLNQAIIYFQQGNTEDSKRILLNILKKNQNFFDALHLIGIIYAMRGDYLNSIGSLKRAININSNNHLAHFNLAKALSDSGDTAGALKHNAISVKLNPHYPEAWLNYGKNMACLGRYVEAINCYDFAIQLRPDYVEAISNKGVSLNHLKRHEEALSHYERAINLNPNFCEAWSNKGITLNQLKRRDEALAAFDYAIEVDKYYANAWSNRGIVLRDTKRYEEALAHYERAILLEPNSAATWSNKAGALNDLNRYAASIEASCKAIELDRDFAGAYVNRAYAYAALKKIEKSLEDLNHAILLDPENVDGHMNRAILYFSQMKFVEGWQDYGARWKVSELFSQPLETSRPIWRGEPGRVLVWREQGVGDEIFYASIFNELKNLNNHVTLSVDSRLINLFERSFPSLNFIGANQTVNESEYDYHIPLCDLGAFFRKDISDFEKSKIPYLFDDIEKTIKIRKELHSDKSLICGLSWGSKASRIGDHKSIPLSMLREVIKLPGFTFVNLQYGDSKSEIKSLGADFEQMLQTVDGINLTDDFDGLSSLIKACDVVITISNTTAHLAGALGVNSLLMLPNYSGKLWYWLERTGRSLIYPNTKIINQEIPNDWSKTVEYVKKELELFYAKHN